MTTYKDLTRQDACARCEEPASMWSGVEDWRDDLGRWIGWCSRECQNAWIAGDKGSAVTSTVEKESEGGN